MFVNQFRIYCTVPFKPDCREWQLHTQDFSQNIDVHTDFKQDLLSSTFKTKESQALHMHTPWTYWFAQTRFCQELPYFADWVTILSNNEDSCTP